MDYLKALNLPKPDPELNLLPVEILEEIIGYVIQEDDKNQVNQDLLALSRLFWKLKDVTEPFLLTHNVEYMGGSGLRWATYHQDRRIIEELINRGARITSDETDYPLSIAVKRGDVDTLKFLLEKSSAEDIEDALSQAVNDVGDTVLHWAIFYADVPCVKVLLEAGADATLSNNLHQRPIEFILKDPRAALVSRYAEITNILLARDPSGFITCEPIIEGSARIGIVSLRMIGQRAPLSIAAERGCVEIMKSIIDANVEAGNIKGVYRAVRESHRTVPEGFPDRFPWEKPVLLLICEASKWPSDQQRCEQYLAGVKLLLLYEAIYENDRASLFRSCFPTISINDPNNPKLHAIRLQRDVIHELIEHGADVDCRGIDWETGREEHHFAPIRYLRTVEYYIRTSLNNTELARLLEPEDLDITIDSSSEKDSNAALLRRIERVLSPCSHWDYESKQIYEALTRTFQLLVEKIEGNQVSISCDQEYRTLLHRAATIPGIFGVFATIKLLEEGAEIKKEDQFGRNALDWAIEQNRNRAAVLLMQCWREFKPQKDTESEQSQSDD